MLEFFCSKIAIERKGNTVYVRRGQRALGDIPDFDPTSLARALGAYASGSPVLENEEGVLF